MKCKVITLDNKAAGEITLADEVFLRFPFRKDILLRMVNYQLAKRRAGNHKTKNMGEVQGSTRKTVSAKGYGTGAAGFYTCAADARRWHCLWSRRGAAMRISYRNRCALWRYGPHCPQNNPRESS